MEKQLFYYSDTNPGEPVSVSIPWVRRKLEDENLDPEEWIGVLSDNGSLRIANGEVCVEDVPELPTDAEIHKKLKNMRREMESVMWSIRGAKTISGSAYAHRFGRLKREAEAIMRGIEVECDMVGLEKKS